MADEGNRVLYMLKACTKYRLQIFSLSVLNNDHIQAQFPPNTSSGSLYAHHVYGLYMHESQNISFAQQMVFYYSLDLLFWSSYKRPMRMRKFVPVTGIFYLVVVEFLISTKLLLKINVLVILLFQD